MTIAVPPRVSIGIVTWNSANDIAACIVSVRALTHQPVELLVVDNASTDGTRDLLADITAPHERCFLDHNVGFSAAHNLAIHHTTGEYYLTLNPDVRLTPGFVTTLIDAMESVDRVGSATGKLLRATREPTIDSTGIYMISAQRHLDRGAGEPDRGQYDYRQLVFGASGAAGFYRRAMLEDVAVDGEIFDEAFFAYREDADLAWRAQLLGWRCVYEPAARATHVRRVTPARRRQLPASINRLSVRNRFLLRIKNQLPSQAIRYALPTLWRDAQVIVYAVLREPSSLPALVDVVRLLRPTLRKRRSIMRRRRASVEELNRWFYQPSHPSRLTLMIFDLVRSSKALTYQLFGVRVHRKVLRTNWDFASLAMKRAIDDLAAGDASTHPRTILDMGCGGVALMARYARRRHPQARIVGVDYYDKFVSSAATNVERDGTQLTILRSDLFENVTGTFDLVLFNPPYVPDIFDRGQTPYRCAYFAGPDGTDTIRRFLQAAPLHLESHGHILLGVNTSYVADHRIVELAAECGLTVVKRVAPRLNPVKVFVLQAK